MWDRRKDRLSPWHLDCPTPTFLQNLSYICAENFTKLKPGIPQHQLKEQWESCGIGIYEVTSFLGGA